MIVARPVALAALIWLAPVWLGAIGAPALAQEQDQAAATGDARCPAGSAFPIGGETFGPGDVAVVETRFSELGTPLVAIELAGAMTARETMDLARRIREQLGVKGK